MPTTRETGRSIAHMTHHVMNQMGHEGPNTIGVDPSKLSQAVKPLIPDFMPMGTSGIVDIARWPWAARATCNEYARDVATRHARRRWNGHAEKQHCHDGRSWAVRHDHMGGMLAVFKVRENMTSYADPGWYEAPPGTVAQLATQQELQRDGIAVAAPASQPGATVNKLGTNHKNMPGMKH